ncbi:MAG: hypothetical protein IJZ01_07790 [Paraprevotella sp.]|nr:hypothetical protein [Paraprevotella sp.]MBQ8283444.1 hypothetical protein [Paraprevotella sp.]
MSLGLRISFFLVFVSLSLLSCEKEESFAQRETSEVLSNSQEGVDFENEETENTVESDEEVTEPSNELESEFVELVLSYGPRDAVDLKLPSGKKWAAVNIGANTPIEDGYYLAWGELQPKDSYEWNTYKYSMGAYNELTKYCTDNRYGYQRYYENYDDIKYYFEDGAYPLQLDDDAANHHWGSKWRMPSVKDFQELEKNCTWTWVKVKNVYGYKIEAENGEFIFLPASESKWNTKRNWENSYGCYWSKDLDQSQLSDQSLAVYRACILEFTKNGIVKSNGTEYSRSLRSSGHSVRAVLLP